MSSDNVVPFGGVTRLDLDADMTLDQLKGRLKGFIIAGYTNDDMEFFSSTFADGAEANWLADRFKAKLMQALGDYE